MQGSWENGVFVLASTRDAESDALRAEIERLRDVIEGIATPLAIDGDNHAAAVKHARASLAAKEDK